MEKIQTILYIAGIAATLLTTTITFLTKFIKAVKERNIAEAKRLLQEGVNEAVQLVEQVKSKANSSLDGPTKKAMAINEIKAYCVEHKIKFDADSVSEMIEAAVQLAKIVNPRKETSVNGVSVKM